MLAASGKSDLSQGEFIELLAGPPQQSAEGQRIRQEMAGRMRAVLDDQRLVSLDTLVRARRRPYAHGAGSARGQQFNSLGQ